MADYVLMLCGWYPSRIDPLNGDFVQRHAKSLATQVPVVVLFAVKDTGRRRGGIIWEHYTHDNLEEYIAYYPEHSYWDKWWSQSHYLQVLIQWLPEQLARRGHPKLVHINIVRKPALWWFWIKSRYPWPMVATENSTEYQDHALPNFNQLDIGQRSLMRKVFKSCRMFIPVSHQLGEQVGKLFGEIPFEVVPNAVDTQLFKQVNDSPPTGQFIWLHISTLGYQKNSEGLLRVAKQILQQHPNAVLRIVGPLPPDQSAEHYKHPQIQWLGLMSYAAVAQEIQACHALVLFSRFENLPCVILEALCCGKPVVSSRVGGIYEVVDQENGLLVPSEDETALAQAMEQLMANYNQYHPQAISEKAAATFNYEAIGKAFIEAYKKAGIDLNS